jgi:hypothetical protein
MSLYNDNEEIGTRLYLFEAQRSVFGFSPLRYAIDYDSEYLFRH